jgi:hypothetical protein
MTYGHSRRSLERPQGNTMDWRIQCSNMLVINMMVILTVLRARRCQFCIEQPASSRIGAGRNLPECSEFWRATSRFPLQSGMLPPGRTTSRHPVHSGIRPHGGPAGDTRFSVQSGMLTPGRTTSRHPVHSGIRPHGIPAGDNLPISSAIWNSTQLQPSGVDGLPQGCLMPRGFASSKTSRA